MARARADRDEWRRRVERWTDSGLTAKEFAAEMGINAGTLQFWRYKLRRTERAAGRARGKAPRAPLVTSLVEVRAPAAGEVIEQPFEIMLANGRRVRVGSVFDPASLRALLAVVEVA